MGKLDMVDLGGFWKTYILSWILNDNNIAITDLYLAHAAWSTSCTTSHFSSVAQSCPTLQPHELQHARPPCPSPTPGAYSNLMSIESVIPSYHLILCHPFSSHLQIFPASGSFPMSRFFTSGGPSIGVSA